MSHLIAELQRARRRRGLTQRDVAEQMGTTQSAVARLEGGGAEPRASTMAAYAEAVGTSLGLAAPDLVRSCTDAVRDGLTRGDADAALRAVLQLFADLMRSRDPAGALRLEPPTTGSAEWDAAIAAACERAARLRGADVPGWTAAPSRFLDRLWLPVEDVLGRPVPALERLALASSPPEFAVRGVLIDAASLDDV